MPIELQISPNKTRRVVLVGYAGAQSLDLIGPFEVFSMANFLAGTNAYDIVLASSKGGEIACGSGIRLGGAVALAELSGEIDTLLISGGGYAAVREVCDGELPAWLFGQRGRVRRIGSVCSGSFILAASGLLDHRRATTHWGFSNAFRSFRPAVDLQLDAIFVADPPYFTSAGVTAGFDLCLSLVESDMGTKVALDVARNLVLFLRRPG